MKSPKIPPPPAPSTEELNLLRKQTQLLDQQISIINDQMKQNKELGMITAVSSGIYKPVFDDNGKLIDATLDADRLASMMEDFDTNQDINRQLAERFQRALNGELPVSEALIQAKDRDFTLLKENSARRGNRIMGETLEDASTTPQDSTSANEMTARLSSGYRLREDAERRGVIDAGVPVIGGQSLSLATGGQQSFGPGASLVGFSNVSGQIPGALEPYRTNRQMEYDRNIQNAALRSQNQAAIYSGISQGVGMGAAALLL